MWSLHAIARTAAVLGGTAVALGAFGAHGLEQRLVALGRNDDLAQRLQWFDTGVRYQFFHALALLVLGFSGRERTRTLRWAAAAFVAGIALFSGSLYGMTLLSASWRFLGAVTPLGGLALIAGWTMLAAGPAERSQP